MLKPFMKLTCAGLFGAVALIALPGRALASGTGYICSASLTPTPSDHGSSGYLYVTFYSGPGCTGSYLDGLAFCSTGATSVYCDGSYLYADGQLSALLQGSQSAAANSQKLSWSSSAFKVGGPYISWWYYRGQTISFGSP